jgi:hypothetical protein
MTTGKDNLGFQGGRPWQSDMVQVPLEDLAPAARPSTPSGNPETETGKRRISWFDAKMICIGSAAMMFARISGKTIFQRISGKTIFRRISGKNIFRRISGKAFFKESDPELGVGC